MRILVIKDLTSRCEIDDLEFLIMKKDESENKAMIRWLGEKETDTDGLWDGVTHTSVSMELGDTFEWREVEIK